MAFALMSANRLK